MSRAQNDFAGFEGLYRLQPSALWRAFASDSFAFWMACGYLFFEYIRPQAIWPVFDAFPYWGRTFILLALVGWLFESRRRFVWTSVTSAVFALLGIIVVSSHYAYWPEVSRAHFMDYFNWVVIFFVLTQTVTTRTRFYVLLLIFFLASFKLSLYGARSWASMGFAFSRAGISGPLGYFNNPGELAVQMIVFAPIALYFARAVAPYVKRWQLYVLYLMPITAALTTLGTNTRGGQLALAVQAFALMLTQKHRLKALLLVAALVFVGYHILPEDQKSRFETAGSDTTSMQRLMYWKYGWQMMKEHPGLGVGYFNFQPYFTQHYPQGLLTGTQAELPHNIFIQVGTDAGFTGLAVFMFLLVAGFLTMRRVGKEATVRDDRFVAELAKGMNLALLGYVVAGQFVTITYYPFLWIHLAFVTMMHTFWREEQREQSLLEAGAKRRRGMQRGGNSAPSTEAVGTSSDRTDGTLTKLKRRRHGGRQGTKRG